MPTYDQSLYQVAIVVSALLFGFLLLVLFARLRHVGETQNLAQKMWLPWADALVIYVGMPTIAIGGLMLPLMGLMLKTELLQSAVVALTGFGFVVTAFYPIALASHFGFAVGWNSDKATRRTPTSGEAFMVVFALVVAVAWVAAILK